MIGVFKIDLTIELQINYMSIQNNSDSSIALKSKQMYWEMSYKPLPVR